MRLSRRDYKGLVNMVRMLEKGKTKRLMWGIALAELCKDSNPKFDKKKFVDACATEEVKDA